MHFTWLITADFHIFADLIDSFINKIQEPLHYLIISR